MRQGYWRAVLVLGAICGVIGGVFELAVQAIAAFIAREPLITPFTRYVSTAISFLIIGMAARRLAEEYRSTRPGWQVGAVIGALSALIGAVGGRAIALASPVGQTALARLSAQDRALASDPTFILAVFSAEIATLVLFGALIGWLAAWSVVRFGPKGPKGPPNGKVK
jgi:hypothetical protein